MMPAEISFIRSTWRAQRAAVATLLLFLLSLLLLPQPAVAAPLERPNADQEYVHVVRAGETLASIAASYGISVQDLRASNNLVNRAELVSCAPNADSTQAPRHSAAKWSAGQWVRWSSVGGRTAVGG